MTDDAIALTIEPRVRDIGNFSVYRILPVAQRRSVGPFVFLDRHVPAVRRHGYLLATIAVKPPD